MKDEPGILEGPAQPAATVEPAAATASANWRVRIGLLGAPLLFALFWWLGRGLTPQGRALAGILAAVAVLWITEAMPLAASSLLGALLCVLLGVADIKTVLIPFADPIVFLFMGSFILAESMRLHGLDRRLAMGLLSLRMVSASPGRVVAAVGVMAALVSMWVSNTATAAMMLPLALGILRAMGGADRAAAGSSAPLAPDRLCWGVLLMVAYGASIGGIATPVGTPPNLIGIALIRQNLSVHISFLRWMMLCVPLFVVMMLALTLLLRPRAAQGVAAGGSLRRFFVQQRRDLGPWTAGQINTLVAFAVAVVLWLVPGILAALLPSHSPVLRGLERRLPEAAAALVAALLLFVLPTGRGRATIDWSAAARIDWGTILLFGGGLSLGGLMFKTGVADALGRNITGLTGASSLWALTAVCIAMAIALSELTSNTASANMVIPVAIALAQAAGVSALPPALGACLGASLGFMLPVSTPPNAIVYGSGLVPTTRMIRAGIAVDVLGFFVLWGGLRVLCPVLGLV